MPRHLQSLLLAAGCMLVMLSAASTCHAGIQMPEQFTFDEQDLAASLATRDSASTSTNAASTSVTSSSSSAHHVRYDWWSHEQQDENHPLELAKSKLPMGTNSSSTSPSPVGGASSSGGAVCTLSASLTLRDDSPLGQLAEDHGLSLPDPPGTDLLRPPRA